MMMGDNGETTSERERERGDFDEKSDAEFME